MISEAIAFEMSYWKRWKFNFIGSYLDSVGLLFAIILLMKFRSPQASITSPEYAFFIIGFLSRNYCNLHQNRYPQELCQI